MRRFVAPISIVFLILPTLALAEWQIAEPTSNQAMRPSGTREPFIQTPANNDNSIDAFPQPVNPRPSYAITVSGSLRENLQRIMDRYHWRVVWKAESDYNFDGRVAGDSLQDVIEKLLKPFPLQAVMYTGSRTMVVLPQK